MSDRWTDPAEECAQAVDGPVDESRLTGMDRLVLPLPRRTPMSELGQFPPAPSTIRNVRNRDRVIE